MRLSLIISIIAALIVGIASLGLGIYDAHAYGFRVSLAGNWGPVLTMALGLGAFTAALCAVNVLRRAGVRVYARTVGTALAKAVLTMTECVGGLLTMVGFIQALVFERSGDDGRLWALIAVMSVAAWYGACALRTAFFPEPRKETIVADVPL